MGRDGQGPQAADPEPANITNIREMKARIVVFGVGGAGGNAINNMITAGLQGVDFIVANTDAQALTMSMAVPSALSLTIPEPIDPKSRAPSPEVTLGELE